ncbi:hypothetical protein TDB9533_04115 [Thalassocella blandensis]|nr:hypothetical protein TDB9533_04115 [Thalassocella blandensis]
MHRKRAKFRVCSCCSGTFALSRTEKACLKLAASLLWSGERFNILSAQHEKLHLSKTRTSQNKGKIIHWDDDKGFGFIRDKKIRSEIFFHISAVTDKRRRPKQGCGVIYALEQPGKSKSGRSASRQKLPGRSANMEQDKLRASYVEVKRWIFYRSRAFQSFMLALGFIVGLAAAAVFQKLPLSLSIVYLLMSCISFVVYARDKSAAAIEGQRTPEMTLHWLSLFFGWPGANFAQQYLRHKSQKKQFRVIYYVCIAINILFLLYLLHPEGEWLNTTLQAYENVLLESLRDVL